MDKGSHFVLVHGANHGAWCWYKMVPLLRSLGHRVTAVDLAACGANPKRIDEIESLFEVMEPLMELMGSIPDDEKVILVGHSFGGLAISLAMERFPEKILVAVYVTAMMPNYSAPVITLYQEFFRRTPLEIITDNEVSLGSISGTATEETKGMIGPKFLATSLYQNSPPEDLELAKMLVRPGGLFLEDLSKESLLTEGRFGSVDRVFVVCEEDKTVTREFQEWMIVNNPPKEVKFMSGSDHMPMMSKPKELLHCFQEIAEQFV